MYNEITRISVIAILALIIGVGGGWFFTRSHYEPIILAKNAEIATIDKINLGLIENYNLLKGNYEGLAEKWNNQQTDIRNGYYDYYDNEDVYDGGAICKDGARSYSTGSGTCSHHRGILYYL